MNLAQRIRNLSPSQRATLARRLGHSEGPREKEIVAYWVARPGVTADANALREFLGSKLPEFMVPAEFVMLDSLPLSPNGKVDRNALPSPDPARPVPSPAPAVFDAKPANEIESKLANIWSELLHVETVRPNDNFFRLGGHSLLALQVMARVRETFKADLPLKALFDFPTIAGLAKAIANRPAQKNAAPIRRIPRASQSASANHFPS